MAARQWTPEQRAQQREAIKRWKPWTLSTGPVSAQGQAKSSRNAFKGGRRAALREELKQVRKLLRDLEQMDLSGN